MAIEVSHIHKRFGPVHANNDISVTFHSGRIIGVLGENGAGKSTLMKILSGYQPADSGEIRIDGQAVKYDGPLAAITQGIGMLQQDPLDIGAFTVLENFIYGRREGWLSNSGRSAAQNRTRLQQYAQRFGFDLPPDALIETLSIAQRQQLEIVRLLALGVQALILDEPTTGISAEQKDRLFSALRELAEEDGLIVLLVSHKLEDVIALCDEVIVLRAGQLVGQRDMPASKRDLVALMFGGEVPTPEKPPAPPGATIMQIRDLHTGDRRLQLADMSLDVRAGEVIGLAGLDGSGQELFMRTLAGLHPTHSGSVTLSGDDITRLTYRQRMKRGLVFSAAGRLEEGLVAGLTLTEHMALVANGGVRIDWKAIQKRMDSQIEQYDVRGRSSDNIEQLSGGNQQRVLMSLLPEAPRLMILEQPTRGLDVESAAWIWEKLLERRKTSGAIIFSSPELDELITYSDRIIVFYAGHTFEVKDAATVTVDQLGHLIGGEFDWKGA